MSDFNKEDAYKNLERVNYWLGNGDTKISFALSFIAVFLGFIFTSDSITDRLSNYSKLIKGLEVEVDFFKAVFFGLLFLLLLFFLIKATYFLLKGLRAKIEPEEYRQAGMESKSILFWGSVAQNNYNQFKNKIENVSEQKLINDINTQTFINSKICTLKFSNFNLGVDNLKKGIIVFILFQLLDYCL
ncbi:hypothetical protein ACKA0G_10175 [Priestia megaterium]|uniref:hypothetical protein n=1 Tax=Priestia megaterium TaxID=1404 RepID=UPI0038A224D4